MLMRRLVVNIGNHFQLSLLWSIAFFVFSRECKTSSRFDMWYNLWNLSITESDFVFGIWFDSFASIEFSVCGGKLCCLAGICRRFSAFTLGFSLRGLADSNFLCRTRNDSLLLPLEVVSSETRVSGDNGAVPSKGDPPRAPSATSRRLWSCVFPKSLWEMPSSSEKRRERCKYLFQMIDFMEMKGSNGC